MRNKKAILIICILLTSLSIYSQDRSIKELNFLIGTWETREDNDENGWWETSTRVIQYTLKGNFIELKANSIDSNGRKREYFWYINYNKKTERFEMTSMFSNWYKVQLDILSWNPEKRTLTIVNNPNDGKFPERFGELVFSKDFKSYVWKGENKYGDPNKPSIWRYTETGKRIK